MAWKAVGPVKVSLGCTPPHHAMALAWVQKKFLACRGVLGSGLEALYNAWPRAFMQCHRIT